MTPQELKNSILQLAMQGKLVEQLPKEDAHKDYPRLLDIRLLPSFSNGGEDVPYDIPDRWVWARLKDIATNQNGYAFKPSDWTQAGLRIIRIQNLTDQNALCNYCEDKEEYRKFSIGNGDVLVSWSCTIDAFIYNGEKAILNQHIFRVDFDKVDIYKPFYVYAIKSLLSVIDSKRHGSTMTHITKKDFESLLFPLPPLAEQKRIVAKIEELLPLIERYEKAWSRLEDFNKRFPGDMQKSILQVAIQGKLVEQRPEEGTGEELYKQIQTEKQALIKAGKIKKEKPLPEITEDEIPFEIPESWKWCRLSSLGNTQTGNTPSKAHPEYFGNHIPFIGPGDIQNSTIIRYDNQGLSKLGMEYGRIVETGAILQVCIGGSIGKCAIAKKTIAFNQQINTITPIIVNSEYLFSLLNSGYFTSYMKDHSGGTATPIINRGAWDAILVPLPPLAEQKRIVEKLGEVLPLSERLES